MNPEASSAVLGSFGGIGRGIGAGEEILLRTGEGGGGGTWRDDEFEAEVE